MLPNRSRFLLPVATFLFAACGLSSARADDADAVKEKLFEAKKAYDAEVQKFRTSVGDALDKREADARKAGNKKQVDQVKVERERFEKSGELPATGPPAALKQMSTARTTLDKAYTTAVKDLVKLKEDAAAGALEKEQQKFQIEAALLFGKRTYLVALKQYDVKVNSDWFSNDGMLFGSPIKLNGEAAPHSIFAHALDKGTAQVKYTLGGKWTVFRATVGVPKIGEPDDPASALTFEVLGDGKSLWKSEPVTQMEKFQTCTVKVERVKVLTLHIHCADRANCARTVWFEPILAE